jgi:hypothetical protein
VALAIITRIVLIAQSWLVLDSDEGTMGIMGLDIAYRGATPVFFYGQNYVGALEAYLAAPMFYLFGPTGFALHCGLLLIYASSPGPVPITMNRPEVSQSPSNERIFASAGRFGSQRMGTDPSAVSGFPWKVGL